MDQENYFVSKHTLEGLEKMMYNLNIELLKQVHKKFLSDLDFEELLIILEDRKKPKFIIDLENE